MGELDHRPGGPEPLPCPIVQTSREPIHVDGPPRTEAARRSLWVTHVADLRVAPEKPLRAEAHPVDPDPSRQAAGTLRCARPLNRDASERTSRKNSREPVVWKAGSALEPLEPTGHLSTARMPPPNCIKRVIASTQCGHVGLRLPSRYGPTLTKIACSCLSKGATAGVRVRRTRLRTESGMLMLVPITVTGLPILDSYRHPRNRHSYHE